MTLLYFYGAQYADSAATVLNVDIRGSSLRILLHTLLPISFVENWGKRDLVNSYLSVINFGLFDMEPVNGTASTDSRITDVLDLAVANPALVDQHVVNASPIPALAPPAPPTSESPGRPQPAARVQPAASPGAPDSINEYAASFSKAMGGPQGWTLRMPQATPGQALQQPDSATPQAAANTTGPQGAGTTATPQQFSITNASDGESHVNTETFVDNVAKH